VREFGRLALLLIAVLVLAGACGGTEGVSLRRGDSGTSDVFELVVTSQGKAARLFGSSHEWYSPGASAFRVEHVTAGQKVVLVSDGSSRLVRQLGSELFVARGMRG